MPQSGILCLNSCHVGFADDSIFIWNKTWINFPPHRWSDARFSESGMVADHQLHRNSIVIFQLFPTTIGTFQHYGLQAPTPKFLA